MEERENVKMQEQRRLLNVFYLVSSKDFPIACNADGPVDINAILLQPLKVFQLTVIYIDQVTLTNQRETLF